MRSLAVLLMVSSLFAQEAAVSDAELPGVYASGSEIAGFSGTTLRIRRGIRSGFAYEELFYSDAKSPNDIPQDVFRGECKVIGNAIVCSRALGSRRDGHIDLFGTLMVYVPEKVHDRIVLFREDSHKAWVESKKVYDYGILVKVRDDADDFDLKHDEVHRVSLRDLFGIDAWSDPFVNGANQGK